MNGDFTENTKKVLAKRAGEKCSLCSKSTAKPNQGDAASFLNLGEAAHICGNRKGPHTRFVETMTNLERSDISNGIWLCTSCHKEIDSDSLTYTIAHLLEIKKVHENKVYLGEFDIKWAEKIDLERRIVDLTALLSEKEKSQTLAESIHSIEITKLRIEIADLRSDKNKLDQSIERFTDTLAAFDQTSSTKSTTDLIEAFKRGDFRKIKESLTEEKVNAQELDLAQKRLLMANVREMEKDYSGAQSDYKKAFELTQSLQFLRHYIGFLMRINSTETAIDICKTEIHKTTVVESLVWINGILGELYSTSNNNTAAIKYFTLGLQQIENSFSVNSVKYKLERAKYYSYLGTAQRNAGQLDEALLSYQTSLGHFWEMTVQDGVTHTVDLANLFNGIGLMYVLGNEPIEALKYYDKAEIGFKEAKKEYNLAVVYLNKAEALKHYKKQDIKGSRKYLELAKGLLLQRFIKNPLSHIETYIGVLTKSADTALIEGRLDDARIDYLEAIKVGEEFMQSQGIPSRGGLAIAYSNYAVFLSSQAQKDDAALFNKKAITLLAKFKDGEHVKHFNLAKAYTFGAELEDSGDEKRQTLTMAREQIERCSNQTLAKAWKAIIEKKILEADWKR